MPDINPVRLYTQLQNTGLQNKDTPLYQLLFQMIGQLQAIANVGGFSGGGGGGGSTIINNITNLMGGPAFDGENGIDGMFIPGPQGMRGIDGLTIPGTDGKDGEDAIMIPGLIGPRGLDGLMGPAGFDGYDGQDGISRIITPSGGYITITTTGNIDDLDFGGVAQIRMTNATLATIRGLKAGYPGQIVTILGLGAARFETAHQNTNSIAPNRLVNMATSAPSPVVDGFVQYQYDSVTERWRMINHDQGTPITPTFSAGDYTGNGAMTWTVDAGDVTFQYYKLRGKDLTVNWVLVSTTVGGTPNNQLFIGNGAWGGFTSLTLAVSGTAGYINDGVTQTNGYLNPIGTQIAIVKVPIANYPNVTNNAFLYGNMQFPVQ